MPELDESPLLPQIRSSSDSPSTSVRGIHANTSAASPTSSPSTPSPPAPAAQAFQPRDGDDGDDRIRQVPATTVRNAAPPIVGEIPPDFEEEWRRLQEEMTAEPTVPWFMTLLGHPMIGLMMTACAGLLGLFIMNQAAGLVAAIASIPSQTGQYVAWGFAGLLLIAVAYSMIRLAIMYYRLRRNRQLRLAGLVEIENRTKLRWMVQAAKEEALGQLETYLRRYPMESAKERRRLVTLGFTQEDIRELSDARTKLLTRDRWAGAQSWFAGFRDTFQARLDRIAADRTAYWARRAGLSTAISPNALADTGLTLYFSFAMLGDLCAIYNLRVGRIGTMVLLTRVFMNSYLAGQMNEAEGLAEAQIEHWIDPHLPVSELALGKILGKVGAKAAAGTANYFLLSRLGRYTVRILRPITRD